MEGWRGGDGVGWGGCMMKGAIANLDFLGSHF